MCVFFCSASAFFVTQTLRALARDGRTVIASIHQPSSEVFELFDRLCLLSNGKTVYFGQASDAYEVANYDFAVWVFCIVPVGPEISMKRLVLVIRCQNCTSKILYCYQPKIGTWYILFTTVSVNALLVWYHVSGQLSVSLGPTGLLFLCSDPNNYHAYF